TAALCQQAHDRIRAAHAAVNQNKSALAEAVKIKDAAVQSLRDRYRSLIRELDIVLTENDPRWRRFGLRMPAQPTMPQPVESLTAEALGEGRVQFNSKQKRAVQTGFDFARAVAELGVDRGIDSFQRFAFIERNGQANLATPLGRFDVRERPLASRLYEFDRWADRLRLAVSDAGKTPPRFTRAMKQLDEAMFALCQNGTADDLRAVLVALGAAEFELANGERFCAEKSLKPLFGLRKSWVRDCQDTSHEFQLAAALASIKGSDQFKLSPLRGNLESVDFIKRDWAANDKGVVWGAGTFAENLSAVLQRRSVDARAAGASHPVLQAGRSARLSAIEAFLNHDTSDAQIESLLWGLMLVNWQDEEKNSTFKDSIKYAPTLPRIYALLKLLFLPDGKLTLKEGGEAIEIKHEPTIIPLLRAGRADEAVQTAVRRLRSSGLVPLTDSFDLQEEDAVRLAAALLIPIHQSAVYELAQLVLRPKSEEN
ncbi:MAG TPA: type I-U CRISPR-associated protein Csx17, partial [Blastocatellia bacterium]|nr:type I-U CRISPR-associated protein Csx17 [Blastocatellia bacterium]